MMKPINLHDKKKSSIEILVHKKDKRTNNKYLINLQLFLCNFDEKKDIRLQTDCQDTIVIDDIQFDAKKKIHTISVELFELNAYPKNVFLSYDDLKIDLFWDSIDKLTPTKAAF